ncbi:MAG: T9SS type A sorting domain-containing protein, partial [Candidatus Marinimicrobia bacterium]|nr:T9SS type A sorting domain-containing protein [Candidatus Neomarinimicrobiota bacterium]
NTGTTSSHTENLGVGQFYWKVRVYDVAENYTDSEIRNFTIGPDETPTRFRGDHFVDKTCKYGIPILLEAKLEEDDPPNYDIEGETVHFEIYYSGSWHEIDDDGIEETSFITDPNGIASVYYTAPTTLFEGNYTIKARYDGIENYAPCSITATLTINKPQWLYMIYMCGDTPNLEESYVYSFYDDILNSGDNDEVSVVVLFDRADGQDTTHDNWTEARYFRIILEGAIYNSWDEVNMGSDTTLDNFVNVASTSCLANNKALVFKDHGTGWIPFRNNDQSRDSVTTEKITIYQDTQVPDLGLMQEVDTTSHFRGTCYDLTGDNLSQAEIRNTLANYSPFGLIAYHACVMGIVENIYDLNNIADFIVASEAPTYSGGWDYQNHISEISNSSTPMQVGVSMVDVCDQPTLGCWDLTNSHIYNLRDEISDFADRLIELLPYSGTLEMINTARNSVTEFQAFLNGPYIYMDLREFTLEIASQTTDPTLESKANTVADRLSNNGFRVAWQTSLQSTLGGLSIYFPPNTNGWDWYDYFTDNVILFTTDEDQHWDDFLEAYFYGVAIDPSELVPDKFALHQNHPNPFNPVTTIRYDLPEQSHVTLVIYDLLGREVKELVSGELVSGYHKAVWDGTDSFGRPVSAGVYFYRLESTEFTETKKLLLVK